MPKIKGHVPNALWRPLDGRRLMGGDLAQSESSLAARVAPANKGDQQRAARPCACTPLRKLTLYYMRLDSFCTALCCIIVHRL